METLINVANEWSDSINGSKVEGSMRRIEVEQVLCAMNRINIRKANQPSGVPVKIFKAGGNKSLKSLTKHI